ncbi:YidH family protein [Enterovibrio nigricans]|uniref:Putative membrane protein n=1 Tax=Enterovibrio nigricans DSM 22720 TaxID=1121868 RepID=A0A1T4VUZ8_9GAMM|nr:DUF202 domain-containing protein [Enterovibrio nigricans]PKF49243.1 DUF202 domain-containing protein [Enterovibrio nigricans]SKA68802.1 putative membrane protein [Enterovibrio nigricans DSM 22720]
MKIGKEPDYRFSLANERTFLAWIRTSLAFLATAIGIDILSSHSNEVLPLYTGWLPAILSFVSVLTGAWAFLRWYQNENAMRLEKPFRYSKSLFLLTAVVLAVGALIAMVSIR